MVASTAPTLDWNALPAGARAALEEQWSGLATGGLPCGSAIVDGIDDIVAQGRNHAYDAAGAIATRMRYPLQHNRLAHAELNALACLRTDDDHGALALWSTQHPCAMCAAAIAFVGIGQVRFIANDPSDHASGSDIEARRAGVPYRALDDVWWWTASNLLFLYNSALTDGEHAQNLAQNRERYPDLVRLTLDLAKADVLSEPARTGMTLPLALAPHAPAIHQVAERVVPQSG